MPRPQLLDSFGDSSLLFNLSVGCCRYEGTDQKDCQDASGHRGCRDMEAGFHVVHGLVQEPGYGSAGCSGYGQGSGGIQEPFGYQHLFYLPSGHSDAFENGEFDSTAVDTSHECVDVIGDSD